MKKETKESFKVLFLLIAVNWIGHFLYFKGFGLYEDDYLNIGIYLHFGFPELLDKILFLVTYWDQGHPLAFLPMLFTFIGVQLGGLYMLYVIAFIILTLNSLLMYKILKKVFPTSEIFAVSGALAFCLFPPDTAKLLLQSAFVLQMSLSFLLIATLLYLNNKKILSYFVILMCIFSYETCFMVFFAVPLLKGKWDKAFRKEMLIHIIVLCSMIAFAFIYRKLIGESRVMEASSDLFSVVYKTFLAMIIGPLMNLFLFFRAPIATTAYWISDKSLVWYYSSIFYFLGICFVLFIWFLYKLKPDYIFPNINNSTSSGMDSSIPNDSSKINIFFQKMYKVFLAAIILLCLGYSLSFTHYPPTAMVGRMTSVHLAATFGGSMIFGCICATIFFLAEKYRLKKFAIIFLSLYLTLIVGYNSVAQKEFVQCWDFQRSFWQKIVNLCPDLKENTVILVPIGLEQYLSSRFIYPFNSYPDRYMISFLFNFPKEWKNPPTTTVFWGDWKENVETKGAEFKLKSRYLSAQTLQDSNVILIAPNKNNELVRIDSSVTVNGKKLNLKPKSKPTLDSFYKTKLYYLLMKPEPENFF